MKQNSKNLKIGLAPMEGVTEYPLRAWYHLISEPNFLCTPFLRATETYPHREWPASFCPELTKENPKPYNIIPQMMSKNSANFIERWSLARDHLDTIDFNCGCPAPNAVGRGAGSTILRDPSYFQSTITEIAEALGPRKLGIKMRLGFDNDDDFAELIESISDLPLARITVHGRTRAEGYKGKSNWRQIQNAAESTKGKIPVWASGDVMDLATLQENIEIAPDIEAIMIGRGALRNPWIFEEIRTGKPKELIFSELKYSLIAITLMNQLWKTDEAKFYQFTSTLIPNAREFGLPESRWKFIVESIEDHIGASWQKTEYNRFALGRTKMLWNSMRSSFPSALFEPQIMRSKSLAEFIQTLDSLWSLTGLKSIPLLYNPALDWMYSGEKAPSRSPKSPSGLQL